ncbi:MAG: PQQ-dependent sugar dehydrogenase, partial [Planctomycetota bacterium]
VDDQAYVATKQGRIWVFRNGTYLSTPFLAIQSIVQDAGEGGMVGFTFDPDFQNNGAFYVAYGLEGTTFGDVVVARYTTLPGTDDVADPNSEEILFGPSPQFAGQHKSGDLEFGPDGMLYFAYGDSDPARIDLPSQDLSDPRGKILRFDVSAAPYIPADNPYVGTPGANPYIWATGFRNPWRIDLDPLTGDLYVADVGTSRWEEVTRFPAGIGGGNGGWPCVEGDECTPGITGCVCPSPAYTPPIAQRAHSAPDSFCSITGGVVYRGSAIPGLQGQYLYTDFCTGTIRGIRGPDLALVDVDHTAQLSPGGQPVRFVADIGRDNDGEIWFVQHYSAEVWRIVPRSGFESYCPANANSTGAGAVITASGSASIGAANLTLQVTDLPPNQFGLFITSEVRDATPFVGGNQGILCLGAPVLRWNSPIFDSGAAGMVSRTTDYTDLPFGMTVQPGDTWNFQYWTRDQNPGVTSNTSSAVGVTFEP